MGCLGSVWGSKQVKIIRLVLFPLGLYLFDVTTDLSLAVQYYNSGDSTWFGLTLGFVLGPTLVINIIFYLPGYFRKDNKVSKYVRSLLSILQLSVFLEYFDLLRRLIMGKDVEQHVEKDLPLVHMLEAMLESVPQLCLQLYILLLTGEQVSVLKVISMVVSLLAAVKAVVTLFYYDFKESDRTCSCGFVTRLIVLTVWKVVELSVRVLAIGLFASAFKAWIALPIGVHWLVMTVTDICIDDYYRDCPGVVLAPLAMAVDTFSMTSVSMGHKRSFWLNTVLTLLGNIAMVTVWYTLKAGQDWYDVPALVGVLWGSLVSAGYGIIDMLILEDEKSQDEEDSPDPEPGKSTELDTV